MVLLVVGQFGLLEDLRVALILLLLAEGDLLLGVVEDADGVLLGACLEGGPGGGHVSLGFVGEGLLGFHER